MLKIILYIFAIIIDILIIASLILNLYKQYKNSKTIDERIVLLLILFSILLPLTIYYLDRYDIFTKLDILQNIDSDRWFNFLATYLSSIFGALIGAVTLVLMTMHQMDRQDKKENEIVRINNMPLLNYKLTKNAGEINLENLFVTNYKNGESINFELIIKNVGMNTIKKSFIVFSSSDFSNTYYSWLPNNGCIEKNECVNIYRYLNLSNGKHTIFFTIYYCDLINNWYKQNGRLDFEITNYFDKNGNIYLPNIIIEKEEFIKEEPAELIDLL